ncbi:MAG: YopX family protein [Bacteroidales bacterium]|nr:YopX family protein [Bacteroidales bacterium]
MKYRGKSIDNDTWIEGDLCHSADGRSQYGIGYLIDNSKYNVVSVKTETIGMGSYLLDSNGREIYAGDVLRITQGNDRYDRRVYWSKNNACFETDLAKGHGMNRMLLSSLNLKRAAVIGNIYDNPDLITP